MSTVFDLHEHVRRLRTTFLYFKNASYLTGAEVQKAQQMRTDAPAQAEWIGLVAEMRALLLTLERLAPETHEPQLIEIARPNIVNLDSIYDHLKSRKVLH
jgi:hypothetical protein